MSPTKQAKSKATVSERPTHTSLLVQRRQSDEANKYMGMIRRPMGIFGQDAGVAPLLFRNMEFITTGVRTSVKCLIWRTVLFDSLVSPLLYWGVIGPTQSTGREPLLDSITSLPAATWFSQEVSHPGTNQA